MKFEDWVAKLQMCVGDQLSDCSTQLLRQMYEQRKSVNAYDYLCELRQVPTR